MKITLPAPFVSGIVSGFILGLSLKSGQDISKGGILLTILDSLKGTVCSPNSPTNVCFNLVLFIIIISIFTIAAQLEDFIIGGIVYAIGFFIGLIWIILS